MEKYIQIAVRADTVFFGDERCVPPDHPDSSYALVMRTLLDNGIPSGCSIKRMEAELPDQEIAAKVYENLLPDEIDVLLLGMGADGHIASLFPNSDALYSEQTSVLQASSPYPPHRRLTITPKVIARAKSVFILATGAEKGRILAKALKCPENFMSLPVCLTVNGTWVIDDIAEQEILKN